VNTVLSEDIKRKIHQLGQQLPLLSDREISRRLNVSRDSAAKYRGRIPTEEDQLAADLLISPETHIADSRKIERLKLENSRLRGVNRMISRRSGPQVESVIEQFKEFLSTEAAHRFEFKPKAYAAPRQVSSIFDADHEEVATLVLSDWHIGETVRPEETNGVNAYNSVIASNRLWQVVDKFKSILRSHQQMYKISSIWVPVLGDMINGSIHPEFAITNDLFDIPASILAARLLIMAILELKTTGLPIEVDCVVGNHPRLVPTMPAKRQAHLSLDWAIYCMVQQKFENDPQVKVKVHDGQFALVEKYGHRFVLEHGYKASVGDAMTDRLRKMFDSPLFREATGLTGASVDMTIIGDKHRMAVGQGHMVNGSLVGQGEYGVMLRLDPINAVQWMFGTSREHTVTYQYALDVTGQVDESASNPMSMYTTEFMRAHGK
jgi:hypothetical protein